MFRLWWLYAKYHGQVEKGEITYHGISNETVWKDDGDYTRTLLIERTHTLKFDSAFGAGGGCLWRTHMLPARYSSLSC